MIKMSSYYYIGHFSRYIKRGAVALGIKLTGALSEKIPEGCAFRNPDGQLAVILMNREDMPLSGTIAIDGKYTEVNLDAHSIGTLLVDFEENLNCS